jgi:hypothetical protein
VDKWFNSNISTNPEQIIAVKGIISGDYAPAPYIIYGPPG